MSSRSRLITNNKPRHSLYIRHLHLLVLSLLFAVFVIRIITTKLPDEVANVLIFQSYLPLLIPFFLCITFLSGYLMLNIRRGVVIGVFSVLLLLFKLQQIKIEIWWLTIFFTLCAIFLVLTGKTKVPRHSS